jgi:drug/metabolite transporter (DMT)-like permease
MKKTGIYLVFLAAMLWATDAPFRVHLTQSLTSNFIVLGEHFVDVLFVLPILFLNFSEIKKLNYKEWIAIIIIAVGGSALASIAFTEAFHFVNPSVAILLQKLQPIIAIFLAGLILKERKASFFWLWALIALSGAYLISFPNLIPVLYAGEKFNLNIIGISLALLAAILWGASTVLGKFVLNKVNFKIMTSLRFSVAFIFLLLLNWQQKSFPDFSKFTSTDFIFIIIIAIASGVVSLLIYYRGLQDTKASVATIAELGFPMAAVIVNWIFLGANLELMQIVGMAILLFAIFKLSLDKQTAFSETP